VIWGHGLGGIDVSRGFVSEPANYSNTMAIGQVLYTKYLYPFELASVVLVVAIVAAIALTLRRRPGLKVQDVSRQVAVRAEERLRVVKVSAEKHS
jgi:NADH-quinone oxidoreductase subunit J